MSSQLSPGEIRAAAEVHKELGPEYRDAVVESFLEKIDQQVAARIDQTVSARLAPQAPVQQVPLVVQQAKPADTHTKRMLLTGAVIGIFVTGIPSVMVAAASGGGSAVAMDEITFLLALAVILAVVVAIVALGGNLHRSRRGAATDR
jgi:hypothetical protein